MKLFSLVLVAGATAATAAVLPSRDQTPLQEALREYEEEHFLIELGPDELKWVTEEEKWRIRRVRCFETCPS
jgi:hypothetical protein